jgi:hypothetical protein
MLLLDLERAYETVWIYGLLYKLIRFQLPGYLLFTLKAFLEGRSFTVHLNGARSPQNPPLPVFRREQYFQPPSSPFTFLIFRTHRTRYWHCMPTTRPF